MTEAEWVRDLCVKIGKELATDLYQELFLILCEKDDQWIEEKYNSGYWEGFIIKITMNQFYGRRTRFEKYYHQPIGLYDVEDVVDSSTVDIRKEFMNFAIAAVVKDLDWYQKKIWKLYSTGGENIKARSCRSISRATGISRHEILRVVNEIKEKANDWYKQYEHLI